METLEIFKGISRESLENMLRCFNARRAFFSKGQTIHTYSASLEKIGLLLSGKAHLYCIDYEGCYTLLEHFSETDIFGELFTLPLQNLEYIVEADSDCEVLFISYNCIITPCSNACKHHSRLIDNLFHLATKKSQTLSLRINLLSARTIRQKLIHYLTYQQAKAGNNSFVMEMSLTDLAAYLCIDRSSMMRELRAMKEEGLLESRGRNITLLSDLAKAMDVN